MAESRRLTRFVSDDDPDGLRNALSRSNPTNVKLIEPLHAAVEAGNKTMVKSLLIAVNTQTLSDNTVLSEALSQALPMAATECPGRSIELAGKLKSTTACVEMAKTFIDEGEAEQVSDLLNALPQDSKAGVISKEIIRARPTVETLDALQETKHDWCSEANLFTALSQRETAKKNPAALTRAVCNRYGVSVTESVDLLCRALRYHAIETADAILDALDRPQAAFNKENNELRKGIENEMSADELGDALTLLFEHDIDLPYGGLVQDVLSGLSEHPDRNELADDILARHRTPETQSPLDPKHLETLIENNYKLELIERALERLKPTASIGGRYGRSAFRDMLQKHSQPLNVFRAILRSGILSHRIRSSIFELSWLEGPDEFIETLSDPEFDDLLKAVLLSSDPCGAGLETILQSNRFEQRGYEHDQLVTWLFKADWYATDDTHLADTLSLFAEYDIDLTTAQEHLAIKGVDADFEETIETLRTLDKSLIADCEMAIRLRRGDDQDIDWLKKRLDEREGCPEGLNISEALKLDDELATQMIEQGTHIEPEDLTNLLKHGGEPLRAARDRSISDWKFLYAFDDLVMGKGDKEGRLGAARLFECDWPMNDPPPQPGQAEDEVEPVIVQLVSRITYKDSWPGIEYIRTALKNGADPNAQGSEAMGIAIENERGDIIRQLFEHGFNPDEAGARTIFGAFIEECSGENMRHFEKGVIEMYLQSGGTVPANQLKQVPDDSELGELLSEYLNRRQQQFIETT